MRPIFEYDDYRDILFDWISTEKAASRTFSYRYLARRLGLSAPNHMHLVATRQRHLSRALFLKVRSLLNLKARERQFFDLLFERDTERDSEQRALIQSRIARLISSNLVKTGDSDDFLALFNNTVAWFLLMGAPLFDGLRRSELIATVLRHAAFPITEADAVHAVAFLLETGHLTVRDDRLFFPHENLRTGWDLDSSEIKQFHRSNLRLALQSVAWPSNKRFLSNVTVTADAEWINFAKREIRDLCLKLLAASDRVGDRSGTPRQVIALQFALFPFFSEEDKRVGQA